MCTVLKAIPSYKNTEVWTCVVPDSFVIDLQLYGENKKDFLMSDCMLKNTIMTTGLSSLVISEQLRRTLKVYPRLNNHFTYCIALLSCRISQGTQLQHVNVTGIGNS